LLPVNSYARNYRLKRAQKKANLIFGEIRSNRLDELFINCSECSRGLGVRALSERGLLTSLQCLLGIQKPVELDHLSH
jgi:hypothetical protein